MLSVIKTRVTSEGDHLSLSVSIDGTKNSKGITISTAHKCLFGGSFPHHIIPLDGLDESEIKKMVQNENKEIQHAYEINIAVITFQRYRRGETPYVIIAGRPQSSNETSNFN